MFRIREFSRFTRVSVKMLRHYDARGLLKPARVDPATNYRYYSSDQLVRLNQIIALKDLGFSLDEIAKLLDAHLSLDELRGMLRLRRAEIQQQLAQDNAMLAQTEGRLHYIEQQGHAPQYEVVVRALPPLCVASIREIVSETDDVVADLFREVELYAAQFQARRDASPLMLYHDDEYREVGADVEIAVPVLPNIPSNDRVQVYELPAVEQAACVVYTGSYDRLTEVLAALLVWIEHNQFRVAGPLREVYLRFNADSVSELNLPKAFLANQSQALVTEVQLPIQKRMG